MFWNKPTVGAIPGGRGTGGWSTSRATHLASYLNHPILKPSTRRLSGKSFHDMQLIYDYMNINDANDDIKCTPPHFPRFDINNKYVNESEFRRDVRYRLPNDQWLRSHITNLPLD